jgi:hypothetical protein
LAFRPEGDPSKERRCPAEILVVIDVDVDAYEPPQHQASC